ncbi:Flagellin N-methylase [Phycisphaerae bacterium RAS1]|nr:Flagellin N-methylase [Phycisphaerae bacterium RAS1]
MASEPLPILDALPSEPPRALLDDPTYQQTVAAIRAHLETVQNLPGVDQFMQTKSLAQAFFDELNAALALYDKLIDHALAFDGSDKTIQCRKGCSNCCIDLVRGITTPEIINIYHHVRPWPDARKLFEYHRDSAEMFMEIMQAKLHENEFSFGGRDPRVVESHVEYNRRNRPCGFLDRAAGCCRIYPVRPIACRYFFSFDPPELCSPRSESYLSRKTRTVHLPEEIHKLLLEIGHKLGFRPLNYLSGAFCGFAAEVMKTKPITVV